MSIFICGMIGAFGLLLFAVGWKIYIRIKTKEIKSVLERITDRIFTPEYCEEMDKNFYLKILKLYFSEDPDYEKLVNSNEVYKFFNDSIVDFVDDDELIKYVKEGKGRYL